MQLRLSEAKYMNNKRKRKKDSYFSRFRYVCMFASFRKFKMCKLFDLQLYLHILIKYFIPNFVVYFLKRIQQIV